MQVPREDMPIASPKVGIARLAGELLDPVLPVPRRTSSVG